MKASTELILPKPNVALVMVHRAGKLTGIARKMFNSVLYSSINQLGRYKEAHGTDPDNKFMYEAPADEILDVIEVGKSNLKSELRKHMKSLREADVDWEAPDANSSVIWQNMSLLSQAEIVIRNGRLWARWALPPFLNEAISDPKKFPYTKTYLNKVALLQGYTAVALYDICSRYRNNFLRGGDGVCLTCANHPDWWVDALTNNIPKIDKASGLVTRREWRKVKYDAVLDAIEQINSRTDIEIELIESKNKGEKAIGLVQFSLRNKRAPARELPQAHLDLIADGIRLGLPESRVESALEAYTVGEVKIAIAKFEARRDRKDLAPLEKPVSYFASLFQNTAPIEIVEDANPVPSVAQLPRPAGAAEVEGLRTKVRSAFMALSDKEKGEYGRRALDSLTLKKMATPRIISNATERVWSGVLLAEMVEIYGQDEHGPDWATASNVASST